MSHTAAPKHPSSTTHPSSPAPQVPPTLDDAQQSWLLAETFKYWFLLFSPDSAFSLDDWVLNTEAHPLRVWQPSEAAQRLAALRKGGPDGEPCFGRGCCLAAACCCLPPRGGDAPAATAGIVGPLDCCPVGRQLAPGYPALMLSVPAALPAAAATGRSSG